MPGSTLAYQASRLNAMLPVAPDLVFLSSGHNYGAGGETGYLTAFTDLVASIRAKWPNAGIVICSQNPEFTPWAYVGQHLRRLTALRVKAMTEGWGYVPVLEAFLSQPDGGASMVNPADGIHPLPSGSQLWAAIAHQYLASKTLLRPS
jgi:lysophospholipase L1-like esterase